MPSAADGSTTRPARSRSIRSAMIDASWTRTASSATRRRSSRTAGMDAGRRRRQRWCWSIGGDDAPFATSVIAGAPSGWTQITSTRARRPSHMTHTGGQCPAAESDQDGVERRHGVDQFQAYGAAPSQVSMSRLSSTSRMPSFRAMAAARSRAISMSPSTNSNLASNARMRSSLAAGAKRDATTVTSSPRPRPDQARAWPRLPALAHTTARESVVGEQARDDLGAAGLEAADRVRRFELDAHRAPETGLQCLAAVQRRVEKNRVDYPASRPDPSDVEARLLHDTAA